MANKVRLNSLGVAQVLKGPLMQAAIRRKAEEVAAKVRAQNIKVGDVDGGAYERDLPVTVTSFTTDRAKALVTLAHPAGEAVQAKHGSLTKAAREAGLDVST